MMERNSFQNALFTLHWDGVEVGHVIFAKSRRQMVSVGANITQALSQRSEAGPLSNGLTLLPQNLTNMVMIRPKNDQELKVSLALTGEPLTVYEVFITVLSGMAYVAGFLNTQKVEDFWITPATYDTELSFTNEPDHLPINAPVLEARWIIIALGLIPCYMIEKSDFREVVLASEADGQRMGHGYIERGRK